MKRYRTSFWILVLLMAVIGMLGGLGSLILGLFLPSSLDAQMDLAKVGLDVAGLLALGFSAMLFVTGWRGWKNHTSPPFYLPHGWITPLVLWGGLIALVFLLPGIQQRPLFLAAIHLLLIILPAFLLLILTTLAAGKIRPLNVHEVVAALTGGALSTSAALILETLALLLNIFLVVIIFTLIPGGVTEIERLLSELQQLSQLPTTAIPEEQVLNLLKSPVVLSVLGLTLAVATPLIEELGKTAIVPILGIWEQFDLRRAFLWGVACGIGFAVVEGALNGLMSAGGPAAGWAAGVTVRALATAMHAFTSGLVGLGWGYVLQKRRRWMFPILFLAAAFFHGLWNFSTIGLIAGTPQTVGETIGFTDGIIALLGSGTLLVLALAAPSGLIALALWLRHRDSNRDRENA